MDFYDLKGVLEGLLDGMHVTDVHYEPVESFSFHPGKCAQVVAGDQALGVFGELHPTIQARYDFGGKAVLAAELDLKALLAAIPATFAAETVSPYPPVLEDLAVVVDEEVSAERVAEAIRQGGGKLLAGLRGLLPRAEERWTWLVIGFIVVSTAIFVTVGRPVKVLILVGALNEKMLQLAGELGDGIALAAAALGVVIGYGIMMRIADVDI